MHSERGGIARFGAMPAILAAGACIIVGLLPGPAASTVAPARVRQTSQYWITSRGTISAIDEVDPRVVRQTFASRRAVALNGWDGSVAGRAWASYAEFRADVKRDMIPSDVRAAMYDPEGWEETPPREQRHPIRYIEKFARLAHSNGYVAIVTPHPGLVSVPGAECGRRPGESQDDAYVRCRIAERTARFADVYETQAQALENNPQAYRAFVLATAEQAREANPDVVVLSGLSTSPGYAATDRMLYAAWSSVADVVDGHYLSLARQRYPGTAAEFLAEVA